MSKNIRSVIDTLREINDGKFINELSDDFNSLIGAVKEHDKKGEITIKLSVTPLQGTDGQVVTISPQVSVKAPKQTANTMFHVTDDNNVQRRDPRQPDIPGLDLVDKETGEIKEVDNDDDALEVQ